MKHNFPAGFAAVRDVQVHPSIVSAIKLVDAFQSALGTQFHRAGLQHFIEIFFLKAVLVCALGKDDHYALCIAHASVVRMPRGSRYLWLSPPSIARSCPVTKSDAFRK